MKKHAGVEVDKFEDTWKEVLDHVKRGDDKQATQVFQDLLLRWDGSEESGGHLYTFLEDLGFDFESAVEKIFLDKIVEKTEVALSLVQTILDQGHLKLRLDFVLELLERLPQSEGILALDHAVLALWRSPDDAQAYNDLGNAWSSLGYFERALAAFNKALELNPEYPSAYNDRGVLYINQKQYEQAILDFDRALRLDPNYRLSFANKGFALRELGRYEEALAALNEAARLDPNDPWTFNEIGRIFSSQGSHQQALAEYERALAVDPQYRWAHANKVYSYHELGSYEEALAASEAALRLYPDDPALYNQRGKVFRDLKDFTQAIVEYDRALDRDPNYMVAYANKGYALRELGRYDEALAALDEAARLDPNDPWTHNERGRVYSAQGKYEQALADYDRALAADPQYKWAYDNIGYAYREMGRYEEAIAALDRSLSLRQNDPWTYNERGRVYTAEHDYEKALVEYERALAIDSRYKWAYANKGYNLRELGRFDEARTAFEQALEIDPKYLWALREVAILEIKRGDDLLNRGSDEESLQAYRDARRQAKAAIELDAMDVDSHWTRGSALYGLSAYDWAVDAYNRALELADPSNESTLGHLYHNNGLAYYQWWAINKPRRIESRMIEAFTKSVEKNLGEADRSKYYSDLGEVLSVLGRHSEALECLDRAESYDAANTWVLVVRGKACLNQGETVQARAAFLRVIDKEPEGSYNAKSSWVGLGLVLESTASQADAEKAFERALEGEGAATAQAYTDRARLFEFFGKYRQAMADFERALQADPDFSVALNALSWMLVERFANRQNLEKAINLSQRALQGAPNAMMKALYLDTLGWVYFNLKDYREAHALLAQAAEILPEYQVIRYHLQRAKRKLRLKAG